MLQWQSQQIKWAVIVDMIAVMQIFLFLDDA